MGILLISLLRLCIYIALCIYICLHLSLVLAGTPYPQPNPICKTNFVWNNPRNGKQLEKNKKNKSKAKKCEFYETPTRNRFSALGEGQQIETQHVENMSVGIFKYKMVKRKLDFEKPNTEKKERTEVHPKTSTIYNTCIRDPPGPCERGTKKRKYPLFSNPCRILKDKSDEVITSIRSLFRSDRCSYDNRSDTLITQRYNPIILEDIYCIDIRNLFKTQISKTTIH